MAHLNHRVSAEILADIVSEIDEVKENVEKADEEGKDGDEIDFAARISVGRADGQLELLRVHHLVDEEVEIEDAGVDDFPQTRPGFLREHRGLIPNRIYAFISWAETSFP